MIGGIGMRFVATCLFGLEKLVGEEIDALGYQRAETLDGRVIFDAPIDAIVKCNLRLRFAERVLILLSSFPAATFEELFQGTKRIAWEEWVGREDAFPVKGHSVKSALFSIPDCQKIIKKAAVDHLSSVYGIQRFSETGVTYQIEFFILKDVAYIMIDTSGITLHKRGYRPQSNAAPLRETLAAALVCMSRPREDVLFVDPLCGSGTIAIEAALYTRHIAPGLHRHFAAEQFPQIPKEAWDAERRLAQSEILPASTKIYGFDIDPECIALAKENARRAGVQNDIVFKTGDASRFRSPVPDARGTIVANPPYGERLGDLKQARDLAKAMGEAFRRNVPSWQIYVITSDEQYEQYFGRKADKVRKLYNGMIRCNFYQFFKRKDNLAGNQHKC